MAALIVITGVLLCLVAWAAKAPDRHIDLTVMLDDRHASRIVDQIEAAEAFDKGLTQGLKEDNTND